MKKRASILAAAIIAAGLTACSNNNPNVDPYESSNDVETPTNIQEQMQAASLKFNIANKTEKNIKSIFIAPVNAVIWSENLIPADTILAPDAEQEVSYTYNTADTQWNIMVTTEDDEVLYWTELDLRGISSFELLPEGSQTTL